jgi:hypothetical protein
MPSWEEARVCPKCGFSGVVVSDRSLPARRGARMIALSCENDRCQTQGSGWIVQVNPDNTIATRQPGPKQFSELPDDYGQTEARLRAEYEASLREGGLEIRRY